MDERVFNCKIGLKLAMLNRISSVLTGCAAGIAALFLIEMLSHVIYPIPPGLDPQKPEDLKKIMEMVPQGALGLVLCGGFIGGLVGGIVSSIMAKENKLMSCMIMAAILTVLGAMNAFMFPHPVWFKAGIFVVYFGGAFLGNLIIKKRKKNA